MKRKMESPRVTLPYERDHGPSVVEFMADPVKGRHFHNFLELEHCHEAFMFVREVDILLKIDHNDKMKVLVLLEAIVKQYVIADAPLMINLSRIYRANVINVTKQAIISFNENVSRSSSTASFRMEDRSTQLMKKKKTVSPGNESPVSQEEYYQTTNIEKEMEKRNIELSEEAISNWNYLYGALRRALENAKEELLLLLSMELYPRFKKSKGYIASLSDGQMPVVYYEEFLKTSLDRNWTFVKSFRNSITLYENTRGRDIVRIRLEGTIKNCPILKGAKILYEVEKYAEWLPTTEQSIVLDSICNNARIVHTLFTRPTKLIQASDSVTINVTHQENNGTIVLLSRSLPLSFQEKVPPAARGCKRLLVENSGHLLIPSKTKDEFFYIHLAQFQAKGLLKRKIFTKYATSALKDTYNCFVDRILNTDANGD